MCFCDRCTLCSALLVFSSEATRADGKGTRIVLTFFFLSESTSFVIYTYQKAAPMYLNFGVLGAKKKKRKMSHHGCFELRSGLKRFNRVLGVTRSLVTFSFVFFLLLPLLCFSFSFSFFFFHCFAGCFFYCCCCRKDCIFFFSLCLLVSNELCRKRAGVCVCLVCIFFFLCFRGRGCACCIDYVTVFFFLPVSFFFYRVYESSFSCLLCRASFFFL